MKKYLFLFALFLYTPLLAYGQTSNVGIIQGIWFSQDTYFVGDTLRVYTAVQNNTGNDVEGVAEFFDNGKPIGVKKFNLQDRRISELWMDTTAQEGDHLFSVRITELVNGESTPLTPRIIESIDTLSIDYDSDGDDIGDIDDSDDDNDGYTDDEEKKAGTNPRDPYDHPGVLETEEEKLQDENILEKILDQLSNPNDQPSEKDISQSEDNEVFTPRNPEIVENLSNSSGVVKVITHSINKVQESVVPPLQKIKTQNNKERENKKPLSSQGLNESSPEKTPSSFMYWLRTIYGGGLLLIHWIFSHFIATFLLILFVFYFIIRILARKIKERRDW